ncbi:putative olfactory receptor 2W6 [Chelonia mydas]|uniref:putative olfactory receptor 2W6 n=1 Tax=Chelonia mydas TaxID=8469 RepID=UPI001CA95EFD|nr:putative olfactory receptor 2W6 [Chelonia mydas]
MANTEWENQTYITEFILLGFGNLPELHLLLFLLFLAIYILTVGGNLLIILLILTDHHLHTPMYFFLWNLSFLETCYTSNSLPRMLESLLTAVIKLSCSETHLMELVVFLLSSIFSLPPLLLTLSSYLCILSTILRIPSTTGRQKAFSTCSSHLIVVTLFYGTIIIVYLLPKNNVLRNLNKVFSLFYTVLTPMANPFIYTLRNKEVKNVLSKGVRKIRAFMRENIGT